MYLASSIVTVEHSGERGIEASRTSSVDRGGWSWMVLQQTNKKKTNNSYEYGSKSGPKVVFVMFWYQVVQKYPKTKN